MANCFRCGRPLENEKDEICVSCQNPDKKAGISLRPWSVFWVLSIILLIPLIIYTNTSQNYILCMWLLIPELFLFSISSYYELKYYNSDPSSSIQISDQGFKNGVISIIVCSVLCFIGIIVGLVCLYNHFG